MHISTGEMLLRLLVAASLASGLGLERELHRRGAGLRTHALVGLAACLFTIASAFGFGDALGPHVNLDASRVAAQVASGIGFIGAGAIIMRKQVVHGLTTAASIWIAAALGVAAGCGLYLPAFGTTAIALLFLTAIKFLEKRLERGRRQQKIVTIFDAAVVSLASIIANVEASGVQPNKVSLITGDKQGKQRAQIGLGQQDRRKVENAIQQLASLPGVHEANANF